MNLEEFKKLVKSEQIQAAKDSVKSNRVKEIIDERGLPAYPSAQWYRNSSEDEKADLKTAVEFTGKSWADYEREMKAHWPKH
jgi:hypothetical protein